MVVEIDNLQKNFKDVKAVDGVSFGVREGELFAFLGVNGAGKSTTINIICGVLQKDGGEVRVFGKTLAEGESEIKRDIGIVFQGSVLDKSLTVYENLKYRAALYGIFGDKFRERLKTVTDLLDLKDILKRTVSKLSGGQRRRADIARALIHDPKFLILDEPTTGLDPKTRRTVWSVVDTLRRTGNLTVLLTTHYMEEAADADYVVILDGGKKVAEGTPHELKSRFASDYIRFYDRLDMAQTALTAAGIEFKRERDCIQAVVRTPQVAALAQKYPEIFNDFEVLKGNMDDVFLKVTGKDLKEV